MKTIRSIYSSFCLILIGHFVTAQVVGTITDESGQPLSFANVYLEDALQGTSANIEGYYEFYLKPGTYDLHFQYLGYSTVIRTVKVVDSLVRLDVALTPEQLELAELEVSADREDPAYAIIRKAMERRQAILDRMSPYTCSVYVKGSIRLKDAPEQIMGQEVGNMGGVLDSNRQGIIYLSETVSSYHYRGKDDFKEIIHSSIVSGRDQGVSFNRAGYTDFNVYDKTIKLDRDIVTPIAPNAMAYYRYEYLGTVYQDAVELHKIKVIPRRAELPASFGVIYIIEGEWVVSELELGLTGKSVNNEIYDTMHIRQQYLYIDSLESWHRSSQLISFGLKFFGFRAQGEFVNIYSQYRDLEEAFAQKDREVVVVDSTAIRKDSAFWERTRPIPLLEEEKRDYQEKDSLRQIWESKEFLDSVDAVNNKFKPIDLLAGYDYERSYRKETWSVLSPLESVQYNTVQGLNLGLDARYTSYTNRGRYFLAGVKGEYGVADRKFYPTLDIRHQKDRKSYRLWAIRAGREIRQFNRAEPVTEWLNTSNSVLAKRNVWRVYEADFAEIRYFRILKAGLNMSVRLQWEDARARVNRASWSLRNTDRPWAENIPSHELFSTAQMPSEYVERQTTLAELEFAWRPGERYERLPDRIRYLGTKAPTIRLRIRQSLKLRSEDSQLSQLELSISDRLDFGAAGYSRWFVRAGDFFGETDAPFQHYRHWFGNENTFHLKHGISEFYALPFYEYSTTEAYVDAHWQHRFEGFLLDRLPLMRKLKWTSGFGTSLLYSAEHGYYQELNLGLQNIGWGIFRIFQVDIVGSVDEEGWRGVDLRIGVEDVF